MREPPALPEDTHRLISIREACKLTSLSRSTLYVRVRNGQFPSFVQMGSRKAFVRSEVLAWIKEQIDARPKAAA